MSWSKVKKGKKPIGWWYHKVMCEIGWHIKGIIGIGMYYKHLDILNWKYRINLYGDKI